MTATFEWEDGTPMQEWPALPNFHDEETLAAINQELKNFYFGEEPRPFHLQVVADAVLGVGAEHVTFRGEVRTSEGGGFILILDDPWNTARWEDTSPTPLEMQLEAMDQIRKAYGDIRRAYSDYTPEVAIISQRMYRQLEQYQRVWDQESVNITMPPAERYFGCAYDSGKEFHARRMRKGLTVSRKSSQYRGQTFHKDRRRR